MTLPMIERFPGCSALPRVDLGPKPTPVDRFDVSDMGALLVKRDDLTSPVYGGNKVRKLEFLLGQALAEKRRAVITFGAYGSNHALATAVHATALGLEPHVVLSPQAPGPFAAATLRAHAKLGTVIHLVDGWDGAREAVRVRRDLTERDGAQPLVIPMGGTCAVGAVGYVNAAFELCDQLELVAGAPVPVVFVAGGTLGTAVGLAIGFAAAGAPVRVVSVRVTPDSVASDKIARNVAAQTIELLRSVDPTFPQLTYDDLALELRDDWFEPGYGVVTPETTSAVAYMANLGIKTETTYTGKAVAAMLDDAAHGLLADKTVLLWNTYNSAPMPKPGPVALLPTVLQEYIAECDELFGAPATHGESYEEGSDR